MTGGGCERSGTDCVFCAIVAGELPSTTIAENDRAIAFMDINPVTPGHALAVPGTFHRPARCRRKTWRRASSWRRSPGEPPAAGGGWHQPPQLHGRGGVAGVFHFHVHVIPRYADDTDRDAIGLPWRTLSTNPEEIARIGKLLS